MAWIHFWMNLKNGNSSLWVLLFFSWTDYTKIRTRSENLLLWKEKRMNECTKICSFPKWFWKKFSASNLTISDMENSYTPLPPLRKNKFGENERSVPKNLIYQSEHCGYIFVNQLFLLKILSLLYRNYIWLEVWINKKFHGLLFEH